MGSFALLAASATVSCPTSPKSMSLAEKLTGQRFSFRFSIFSTIPAKTLRNLPNPWLFHPTYVHDSGILHDRLTPGLLDATLTCIVGAGMDRRVWPTFHEDSRQSLLQKTTTEPKRSHVPSPMSPTYRRPFEEFRTQSGLYSGRGTARRLTAACEGVSEGRDTEH